MNNNIIIHVFKYYIYIKAELPREEDAGLGVQGISYFESVSKLICNFLIFDRNNIYFFNIKLYFIGSQKHLVQGSKFDVDNLLKMLCFKIYYLYTI